MACMKAEGMNNTFQIEIENLKCGGCERSILNGLGAMDGVGSVSVDREKQTVQVVASPALRKAVTDKLRAMGYPEKGSVSGLDAGLANAKSFVSCAIGRMS
jgi:copper chaperone